MGEEMEPSRGREGREARLQTLGVLALKWHLLRKEIEVAKAARAKVRETLGPCENMESSHGPCYQRGRAFGFDWCESCETQDPLHHAYMRAVRKASGALTTMRREARRHEAEGLPESPRGSIPESPSEAGTLPDSTPGGAA